jgi:hypothetical protein
LKIEAASRGTSMQELVESLVEEALKQKRKEFPKEKGT